MALILSNLFTFHTTTLLLGKRRLSSKKCSKATCKTKRNSPHLHWFSFYHARHPGDRSIELFLSKGPNAHLAQRKTEAPSVRSQFLCQKTRKQWVCATSALKLGFLLLLLALHGWDVFLEADIWAAFTFSVSGVHWRPWERLYKGK